MHRRLGLTLLYAGAALCALGALGFAFGITITISEALAWKIVRAAAYVAPVLLGAALMGGGAWLLRATRAASAQRHVATAAASPALPQPAVGDAAPPPAPAPDRVGAERRPGAP